MMKKKIKMANELYTIMQKEKIGVILDDRET